jgi:MFS transporter, DHA1 family, inner membrane transport protein
MTSDASASRIPLMVLLLGNFIIGTGVLLPAGLLNDISTGFGVSSATAGLLMLVGGVVVACGAPLAAAFTSHIDRRLLLTFALVLYGVGHLAAALAPGFSMLLIIRALMVMAAAIFTPQAAATVGVLVPPERRAGAIAFIFIGWSAANVVGIPLGGYLASLVGWRSVFGGMGMICLAAALAVWLVLPRGLMVQPLSFTAWKQALTNPVIVLVLLVTLLSMSGQMTVLSYMAPIMRDGFAGGPEMVAIAFAVFGISGVIGNAVASRIVAQVGIDRVIAAALCGVIAGLAVFALGFGSLAAAMAGIAIWGLGSFSSNSLQQSRLVVLAPPLASATVALNTSVVYMGQAVGAGVGGWFVDSGVSSAIIWAGCAFALSALIVSLFASRMGQR